MWKNSLMPLVCLKSWGRAHEPRRTAKNRCVWNWAQCSFLWEVRLCVCFCDYLLCVPWTFICPRNPIKNVLHHSKYSCPLDDNDNSNKTVNDLKINTKPNPFSFTLSQILAEGPRRDTEAFPRGFLRDQVSLWSLDGSRRTRFALPSSPLAASHDGDTSYPDSIWWGWGGVVSVMFFFLKISLYLYPLLLSFSLSLSPFLLKHYSIHTRKKKKTWFLFPNLL